MIQPELEDATPFLSLSPASGSHTSGSLCCAAAGSSHADGGGGELWSSERAGWIDDRARGFQTFGQLQNMK